MHVQKSNFGKAKLFQYQLFRGKYNFKMHIHQLIELVLVLKGRINVVVGDGEQETAEPGDFILILPFQRHQYESTEDNTIMIYTFSPTLVPSFVKSLEGKVGKRAVFKGHPSTVALFKSQLIEREDFAQYRIKSCLYAAIADFLENVPLCNPTKENSAIEKMIAYTNEHFSEPITLASVAKKIGYSSNYLSHNVKKIFSFGFPTLLAYIRVESAKTLITESDKSSLEISLECGFGSERTFNRQFKNITGMTPREYKRSSELVIVDKSKPENWY